MTSVKGLLHRGAWQDAMLSWPRYWDTFAGGYLRFDELTVLIPHAFTEVAGHIVAPKIQFRKIAPVSVGSVVTAQTDETFGTD